MKENRKELVRALFPELEETDDLPEMQEVFSILDELPERSQMHLIENIFCMADMRRTSNELKKKYGGIG